MKKKVCIGFLGPTLDQGRQNSKRWERWERWRPTVAACWQDDYTVDRYEIIYQRQFKRLLDTVVADIKEISPNTEIVLNQIEFRDPWDFEEVFEKLHEFSTNKKFDLEKEELLINITTGTHVAQICLFLLAESKYLPGKLLQLGALREREGKESSLVAKGSARIIDLDLNNYDPIATRFIKEKKESHQFLKSGIETRNKLFNKLIDKIEIVANRSEEPILLQGSTGVGKTKMARRIYQLKKARYQIKGQFVEVNCATLKGDSVMSTLFGHQKGAFTGALSNRSGLLREANGGLLFLDEIGELGLDEQAMLLKAIEDKSFLPMGADREVDSNFQLIAGTNRSLLESVSKGEFREDLLARINLWSFTLPSLCERLEDIEPNIEYELLKQSQKTGKKILFTDDAMRNYLNFSKSIRAQWKGNFRDLNSSIIRMSTLSEGGRITTEVVDEEIELLSHQWGHEPSLDKTDLVARTIGSESKNIDPFDLAQLEEVLRVCMKSKNLSEASRRLFSVSRLKRKSVNDADRLKKYLAKFDITWDMLK